MKVLETRVDLLEQSVDALARRDPMHDAIDALTADKR